MTYTATFSNGQTITRNSERTYTFAWAVFRDDGSILESGFAADMEKAGRAARSLVSYFTRTHLSPAHPRYKQVKKKNDELRAELKTEIVEIS